MKKEDIESMVRTGGLRGSILKSAEANMRFIKKLDLNDESATIIFKETYESVRQLGDAKWWQFGYEPLTHETSLEILKEFDVKEKTKLNHLDRFRKIRNDATYRGYRVTVYRAKELIEFWDKCGKEIMKIMLKHVK